VFETNGLSSASKKKFSLVLVIIVSMFIIASLSKMIYKVARSYKDRANQKPHESNVFVASPAALQTNPNRNKDPSHFTEMSSNPKLQ
jgi:flagellar basal body-associated protein FliL